VAVDLSKSLVIGISSMALFDLAEADAVYRQGGIDAFTSYQMKRVDEPLAPGAAFPLVKAILRLNEKAQPKRRAEVIVMSRNNPTTSLRMFNSIKHHGLDIQRAALTGGEPISRYLDAFSVGLFLSSNEADVQDAINTGVAAGLLYALPEDFEQPLDQIRIAFDGDAVVFSDESEQVYKEKGLAAFLDHERQNSRRPLPEGPFAKLLRALSFLQSDPGFDKPPVRIALVTARNTPAHERVIRTLLAWSVRVDEAFFMGGVAKTKVLEAFKPHIFFDDQDVHCAPASKVVPTARVLYRCESPLARSA
jgi:5'-nucleotidase